VMASDFAIAQFRFLVPLLLTHGRYSYRRIARMVLFFFYKNMLFGTTLFVCVCAAVAAPRLAPLAPACCVPRARAAECPRGDVLWGRARRWGRVPAPQRAPPSGFFPLPSPPSRPL